MIKIRGLTYTYPAAEAPSLRGIDLDIGGGEVVLLEGDSGSGKSTLLYCLNGIIPRFYGGRFEGEVVVNGFDPSALPVPRMAREAGMVFQNPESQIFMPTVLEDVAFGCRNFGMPEPEARIRSLAALEYIGLARLTGAAVDELSGGQKQRLAIAGVYAPGPKVFLFDEAAGDLDGKGKAGFAGIIGKLKSQGAAIIIAEHEPEYLGEVIDRKIYLEDGRILPGKPAEAPFTSRKKSLHVCGGPLLEIKRMGFRYNRGGQVLREIGLEFRTGEFTAVTGDNGSGKTTLFKLISGVLKPSEGRVAFDGLPRYGLDDVCGRIGLLFQNPDEQLFAATVEDEIAFGPRRLGREFDAGEYLKKSGMVKYAKSSPFHLSRGKRQMVAFHSILSMRPDLLILDEPTTGLDQSGWFGLMELAARLNEEGMTVIFSSHNKHVVEMYARRVIRLEEGEVSEDEIRV